jgi:class 3 adenylate cyclase
MLLSSLAGKITLVIVAVSVLGFGASTVWTIHHESALVIEQSKAAARRLAGAIIASIESAMVQERPDVTRALIQELRGASPVEGLDIFRRNGVEAFTDLATVEEVEKHADLSEDVLANIRRMRQEPAASLSGPLFERALTTGQTQESLEQRDGVTLFTLHTPIPNRETCQGCHGSDHDVRAVVRVATSMEPAFAVVRQHRLRQILIAVVTVLAAGGMLTVAMRRLVVRPLQELSEVARRIGAGDFGARAHVGSRDEIGQLAGVFNEMTDRLARARADLETKNVELATTLEHLQESRRRLELLEQIKGELSKFVPEAVKALLERDPNATELEKRSVEVSVLFLDIAGYTRLSEQLDPRQLNRLVQTYFGSFMEIIHAHGGDVNETAGDGLMVIFQAGPAGGDHALGATRAAFAIRQRTQVLNEEFPGLAQPIQLHMGINTGEALVGATKMGAGAAQRWTFTATGPTTNVAARVAAAAGEGEIVVGPATAERIRRHFVLESLGERALKNVSAPVRLFRVIPPGVYEKVVPGGA